MGDHNPSPGYFPSCSVSGVVICRERNPITITAIAAKMKTVLLRGFMFIDYDSTIEAERTGTMQS